MLPDKTRKFFERYFKKHLTRQFIEILQGSLQGSSLKYILNFFQKTICEANIKKYHFNTHNTIKARGENFILKTKKFVLNLQKKLNLLLSVGYNLEKTSKVCRQK